MIVSKTRFRMSFVGGGSDLPGFYQELPSRGPPKPACDDGFGSRPVPIYSQ